MVWPCLPLIDENPGEGLQRDVKTKYGPPMLLANCEEMAREKEGWRIVAGGGAGARIDMTCVIK